MPKYLKYNLNFCLVCLVLLITDHSPLGEGRGRVFIHSLDPGKSRDFLPVTGFAVVTNIYLDI